MLLRPLPNLCSLQFLVMAYISLPSDLLDGRAGVENDDDGHCEGSGGRHQLVRIDIHQPHYFFFLSPLFSRTLKIGLVSSGFVQIGPIVFLITRLAVT